MADKAKRIRRSLRTRKHIARQKVDRLTVHRSNSHIYAQVIDCNGVVKAQVSTMGAAFKKAMSYGGNVEAAKWVGAALAKAAKKAGVERVAFDRSGFKFHGRIKALADAAREGGVQF